MISSEHTQSLADFREKAAETLDRINQTGEAEILTVDGEVRAVLISPKAYDDLAREAQLNRDVTTMRTALRQIEDGQGLTSDQVFGPIREKLLAMKDADQTKAPRS